MFPKYDISKLHNCSSSVIKSWNGKDLRDPNPNFLRLASYNFSLYGQIL